MKRNLFRYVFAGCAMGLILVIVFVFSLPDGKLRLVFCSVGQGDATYILFPDGRDMLIDGGPDAQVLSCIGKHMPFWDRTIDILVVTHPEKDHYGGLIDILRRYEVEYLLKIEADNPSPAYQSLLDLAAVKQIQIRTAHAGDRMTIGAVGLLWLWPSTSYTHALLRRTTPSSDQILGAQAISGYNDLSQVILLSYGAFDVLFTGDAGDRVDDSYIGVHLASDVDVLKVPHHGSKTGMTEDLLTWLKPKVAVISSGKKNSYGHPHPTILSLLSTHHILIKRTDNEGDIILKSDGTSFRVVE